MVKKIALILSFILCLAVAQLVFAEAVDECADAATSADDFYNRAVACYGAGMYEAAVEDFTLALELNPGDVQSLNWRALIYRDNIGDVTLALADFDTILKLDPTNAVAYHDRGYVYAQLGDKGQALANYNDAIQLNPEFAGAYANRGLLYLERGETDLAMADFTRAIELNYQPLDWLYQKRGEFYANQGQFDLALADFSAAIALVPNSGHYYNWRGQTNRQLQQYEAALQDFTWAIELNPQDTFAYTNRGFVWLQLGNSEQSMNDLNHALQLDPNNRDAYLYRGDVYLQMDAFDLALADYQHAVQMDPDYPDVYLSLGNVYYARGDNGMALDHYQRYLQFAGAGANSYIVQRVADMERPSPLAPVVYLFSIAAIVLAVRQVSKQFGFMKKPAPQPKKYRPTKPYRRPDWLEKRASRTHTG